LLQKLRDRSNVEKYVKYINSKLVYVNKLVEGLKNNFSQIPDNLIIAYHKHGYLPASIMYWFITTMEPDKKVLLNEASTITHYILPYHNPGYVVLFSSNPYTGTTLNTVQTCVLTGHQHLLITLKPVDERFEQLYRRYNVLYVDTRDEIEYALLSSIAIYYHLGAIYKDKLGSRGKRLYMHVEEGVVPIIEDLIMSYMDKLEKIVSQSEMVVTSSKILEPTGLYIVEILRRLNIKSSYQNPEFIPGYVNLLLLSTSVDEYFTRELRFKYSIMGVKIEDISMNTDPLEAQIYIALLAYYLLYSSSSDNH